MIFVEVKSVFLVRWSSIDHVAFAGRGLESREKPLLLSLVESFVQWNHRDCRIHIEGGWQADPEML